MRTSSRRAIIDLCALVIVVGASSGCGAGGFDESATADIGAATEPVIVSNCTGAAISAAIVAGGDVQLNCGSAPITINMPATTVTVSTRVRPISTGAITFTHGPTLFTVNSNIAFEIDNVTMTSTSGMGIHSFAGSTTVSGVTFTGYRQFALISQIGARLTVLGSTFSGNGSTQSGFGIPIYSEGAIVDVRSSTFFSNTAHTAGAITAFGGSLSVADSTFYFNMADNGGAIVARSNAPTITNCSFWRNSATSAGGAIDTMGGTIRNCTFADNGSPRGTLQTINAQVFNSVILDTLSPPTAPCQLVGSGNMAWPATLPSCGPGFRFADPKLGLLASNGGPTMTMALQPGSAAIDSAVGVCPTFDQRGVFRPRDGDGNGFATCDVGSYER